MPMDIGFSVVESLKAIEQWINNINTNMVGAAKTGYKTSRISFGGSNTIVSELPANGLLPNQQAEPSMRVVSTAIDYTQGQVVASSQNTHFALKDRPAIAGTNFFVVRELLDLSGIATQTNPAQYRYYLTRDGEFHWVPASRLTSDADVVNVPPNTSAGNTQGFALVNNYNLLVVNRNNGAPVFSDTGNFTLSTSNTLGLVQSDLTPIAVNVVNPQNLIFSRYGSTIFDNDFKLINNFGGGAITSFSFAQDVSQDISTAANQKVDRLQSSLESSNSSITTLIPELTLAQKMFTALSKVLTVFNENLDITFGLIR